MQKRGYWAPRVDAIFMMGKTPYQVDKMLRFFERKGKGKNKLYFIPEDECTSEYRKKNIPEILEDNRDEILTELESNVNFNTSNVEYELDNESINNELKKVRKEKIIKETRMLEEKLTQHKKDLFNEWSEQFFNVFADQFGKFKNILIDMHLTEEQIKIFNETLNNCLNNFQIHLNETWEEYNKEEVKDEVV